MIERAEFEITNERGILRLDFLFSLLLVNFLFLKRLLVIFHSLFFDDFFFNYYYYNILYIICGLISVE